MRYHDNDRYIGEFNAKISEENFIKTMGVVHFFQYISNGCGKVLIHFATS